MPFITEEIWHAIYDGKPPLKSIALARYPRRDEAQISAEAETEMAVLQDLIVSVRNIRAELKIVPKGAAANRGFRRRRGPRTGDAQCGGGGSGSPAWTESASSSNRWPRKRTRAARPASMCAWFTSRRSMSPPNASGSNKEMEKLERELSNAGTPACQPAVFVQGSGPRG